MVEIAQNRLGLDLDDLVRVNVKGKLLFYTEDGEEVTYSLKQAHEFTRPGCLRCPDFAAEHADISFGGLGQCEGWTLTIIRTDKGRDLWDRAIADGVVEWRPGVGGRSRDRADVQARREVPGTVAVAGHPLGIARSRGARRRARLREHVRLPDPAARSTPEPGARPIIGTGGAAPAGRQSRSPEVESVDTAKAHVRRPRSVGTRRSRRSRSPPSASSRTLDWEASIDRGPRAGWARPSASPAPTSTRTATRRRRSERRSLRRVAARPGGRAAAYPRSAASSARGVRALGRRCSSRGDVVAATCASRSRGTSGDALAAQRHPLDRCVVPVSVDGRLVGVHRVRRLRRRPRVDAGRDRRPPRGGGTLGAAIEPRALGAAAARGRGAVPADRRADTRRSRTRSTSRRDTTVEGSVLYVSPQVETHPRLLRRATGPRSRVLDAGSCIPTTATRSCDESGAHGPDRRALPAGVPDDRRRTGAWSGSATRPS